MPGVTLNGYSLCLYHSDRYFENVGVDITQKDIWENNQFKREVTVTSTAKQWGFPCIEQDIGWSDSAAKKLQDVMADGPVTFIVDLGSLLDVNLEVYIKSIEVTYRGLATRIFTVILQEKQD